MKLEDRIPKRLCDFLESIGIPVEFGDVPDDSLLIGTMLGAGKVIVDPSKPFHPGDVLHEAGHLAVMEPKRRAVGDTPTDAGEEMAAIAWSWAAVQHLELDPVFVFHSDGYAGASESIISAFQNGGLLGQPLLAYYRMTGDDGIEFPRMKHWVRPADEAPEST